jgi:hypothetical protein
VEEVGGYESFLWFYEDTGLNLAEVLAEGPSAPKVDPYKKFVPGQSLYNLEKFGELGTQMYLLTGGTCRRLMRDKSIFLSELETTITSVAMTLSMSSFQNYNNYAT